MAAITLSSPGFQILNVAMPDAGTEEVVTIKGAKEVFMQLLDGSGFTVAHEAGGDILTANPGVTGVNFKQSNLQDKQDYVYYVDAAANSKTLQIMASY